MFTDEDVAAGLRAISEEMEGRTLSDEEAEEFLRIVAEAKPLRPPVPSTIVYVHRDGEEYCVRFRVGDMDFGVERNPSIVKGQETEENARFRAEVLYKALGKGGPIYLHGKVLDSRFERIEIPKITGPE